MADAIEWYKSRSEGKRIIDMLNILKNNIDNSTIAEGTYIADINETSTQYVIDEAIRIISECYFEGNVPENES